VSESVTAQRSILIVEDDPEGRSTLERLFRREGFQTEAVENGIEAFAAVSRRRYDVVLLDIRMPGLGGVGFFEQAEERFPNIASRTVFVTAYAQAPEIAKFLKKTGQPVFEKPYDITRLVETTRAIAAQRNSSPHERMEDD
jgi:CheY-like chemotaxis protein